jgi:hypothetical protein
VETTSRWHRLGAATHRRAARIEWMIFALVVLLPPLAIVLLGGD